MPAINKKRMQMEDDNSGINETEEDDDTVAPVTIINKSSVKPDTHMLKGLDGEVLLEKRKRFMPPAELKLSEWLDNNLEKRTEETIRLTLLYNYYTELCQASESDIVDIPKFSQMVKAKFGKAFGVQASSIYKAVIKEKKVGEKKKSGGWKMKEIVLEAINHFGNPWQGVRFLSLKHYVAANYPGLQVDQRPKILKRALIMGDKHGYVEVTKGIGMMGSYRLPGAVEPPPKPKNKSKKDGENEGGDEDKEKDGEEKDQKEAGDDTGATEGAGKEELEASKPKKPKKVQPWSYSQISHSNPARIEDTFPLAITYQSAPKAAGLSRIRQYVLEKYGEEVSDSRWRRVLDNGVDKGYWEHVSGSGMSGTIHLLMDDFDPNSENLEERICAAVIACHNPKTASANTIKKYVSKYHPDFNVDSKPDRFKKALIRAVEKKMIKQLSGLGASGTFMLVVPFTPSPTELAGEDDSDDGDDDDDDSDFELNSYNPRGTKSRGMPKVKTMEVIQPKKSSKATASASRGGNSSGRRGQKNQSKAKKLVASPVASNKRGRKASVGGKKGNSRRSLSPLTDEEEEDDDFVEYIPKKSQSRGGSGRGTPVSSGKKSAVKKGGKKKPSPKKKSKTNTPGKAGKRASKTASLDSDDQEDIEEEDNTQMKSKSKGGGGRTPKQNGTPKTIAKKRKAASYSDGDDDNNDEDSVEYSPRKSTSRGGQVTQSSSKSSKKQKAGSDFEDSDDDEYETSYTPRKSKSRGGGGRASNTPKQNGTPKSSAKKRKAASYSDDDNDDEDSVEYSPRKSTSRGGQVTLSSSKSSQKQKAGSDFEDSSDERPPPKSGRKSKGGKNKSLR